MSSESMLISSLPHADNTICCYSPVEGDIFDKDFEIPGLSM